MLDFMPIEMPKCPENEPVIVQLVDDRYAFAFCIADQYDADWVIQLPFEFPQGAHQGMIKAWAPMPANVLHKRLMTKPVYGE